MKKNHMEKNIFFYILRYRHTETFTEKNFCFVFVNINFLTKQILFCSKNQNAWIPQRTGTEGDGRISIIKPLVRRLEAFFLRKK